MSVMALTALYAPNGFEDVLKNELEMERASDLDM